MYKKPRPIQRELYEMRDCDNPTVKWILNGFEQEFEDKIEHIQKTWNQQIRLFYRDFMGLRTSTKPLRVTFKLDDEGKFARLIEETFPDLDFRELLALRDFVAVGDATIPHIRSRQHKEMLAETLSYARSRIGEYDLKKILNVLFPLALRSPESDVFGCYYLASSQIHVYVIPCILFSMIIRANFVDFTVGVLAHELAHGFCHVGRDKDNSYWHSFGAADNDLVEGLAEFYTREFALHVEPGNPGILEAFKKTSSRLSPTYNRYLEWDRNIARESVYQALIRARRNDIRSFDDFTGLMMSLDTKLADSIPANF